MPNHLHKRLPDQKELEKEIGDYLSKKYGDRIQIVTAGLFPQADKKNSKAEVVVEDSRAYLDFDLKPEDLIQYLDEYVIQQHDAKAVLATKICTHFNRIRYQKEHTGLLRREVGRIKNNVLLIGPTGVGKTYLIKLIAHKIGVPFIKADATKFSETGYVGGDVEDLVRDLVRESDGDIEKAQYGIIYIDEVDKIARSQNLIGTDVSRSGVQRALLKPMEETEVELKVAHDIVSQMEAMEQFRTTGKREKRLVNTKNILFIMSGSFDGLEEYIRKRTQKQTIGFEGNIIYSRQKGALLRQVKAEDLVSFGFESEFIGRLPVVTILNYLTCEDYYKILKNPNCPVVLAKKQDFLVYGIKLTFTDEAFHEIARLAAEEKTGARALVSVLENILLGFEQKLPSVNISHVAITKDVIKNPAAELDKLLTSASCQQEHRELCSKLEEKELQQFTEFFKNSRTRYLQERDVVCTAKKFHIMASVSLKQNIDIDDMCDFFIDLILHIRGWQEKISKQCGLKVTFKEEAVDRILEKSQLTRKKIDGVCSNIMMALEYGLRLLTQKKHIVHVEVSAFGVENPEQFINDLVEKTFKV